MKNPQRLFVSKGFTLVEVVVTVAVLAFGIVMIYEALFMSVDAHGYTTHYLGTQDWVNEQIWQAQAELTEAKLLEEGQTEGEFTKGTKTYHWTRTVRAVDLSQNLYQLGLRLSWNEGEREFSVSREVYLLPPELKPYNEEGIV